MPHGTSRLYNLVSVSMVLHNLVPAALGCVYPVETSTSLYNLYIIPTCCHRNKGEVEYICMYVCMYVCMFIMVHSHMALVEVFSFSLVNSSF